MTALALLTLAQPHDALPFDPRHQRDARCEPAVKFDPAGKQRDPASTSTYLCVALAANATQSDCASACCGDWNCEAFSFHRTGAALPDFCSSTCSSSSPCCAFKDDIDALVAAAPGVVSGVRAKLPARAPPYPESSAVRATLNASLYIGVNGDEFPITWGADGHQYSGAGDNHQVGLPASPLSFFRVVGGPTEMGCDHPATHHDQPSPTCKNVTMTGDAVVITSQSPNKCPSWGSGVPNVKSSGVISLRGVLYWAVSCFNYGDDAVFNRQRYGPAWLITSADGGTTWNTSATPPDFFTGRLAAPRFVQHGRDNAGAPDSWVYVYFPGTSGGDAFFENNDLVLLGRVDAARVLERDAYQFYMGTGLDGGVRWTSDATIARPIFEHALMTSVQQANYIPSLGRYVFANWAWISYDGYPRPDHTADERNDRTGHQRTQLSLLEGATPWGPFSVFYRDDDWSGADGSKGGYTPVIPPAWVGEKEFWLVFTQCCGNPRPPLNNYNFIAQRVSFSAVRQGE